MNRYITSEEAKQLLKLIRAHSLTGIVSEEALLKCFFTIRQMLSILNERAAMDCVCLNMDYCTCGKSQASAIIKAIKSWPEKKTARTTATWYG